MKYTKLPNSREWRANVVRFRPFFPWFGPGVVEPPGSKFQLEISYVILIHFTGTTNTIQFCNRYTCLYRLYHIISYYTIRYAYALMQEMAKRMHYNTMSSFVLNDACEAMSFVFILQAAVSRDCSLLNTALSNHATFTRSQMHLKIRV